MTSFIKKNEIKNSWVLIDAENAIVGRLAAYISKVLRGKDKSQYTPHMDNGDFVVVTNIEKINEKIKTKEIFLSAKYPDVKIANPKNSDKNKGISIRAKGIKLLNISSWVNDIEIQ